MTRGQRKVHVLMWLVLGPIALVGLVLAFAWRPPEPVQEGPLPGVSDRFDHDPQRDASGAGGRP